MNKRQQESFVFACARQVELAGQAARNKQPLIGALPFLLDGRFDLLWLQEKNMAKERKEATFTIPSL